MYRAGTVHLSCDKEHVSGTAVVSLLHVWADRRQGRLAVAGSLTIIFFALFAMLACSPFIGVISSLIFPILQFFLGFIFRKGLLFFVYPSTISHKSQGCCMGCAKSCHAGHKLSPVKPPSSFFCDCGAHAVPTCQCKWVPAPGTTGEGQQGDAPSVAVAPSGAAGDDSAQSTQDSAGSGSVSGSQS